MMAILDAAFLAIWFYSYMGLPYVVVSTIGFLNDNYAAMLVHSVIVVLDRKNIVKCFLQ